MASRLASATASTRDPSRARSAARSRARAIVVGPSDSTASFSRDLGAPLQITRVPEAGRRCTVVICLRPRGRPSACFRCRALQGAQHRGALLQQAQAVPRRRHPLRQTRLDVPGHRRRRIHPDLATRTPSLIYGHGLARVPRLRLGCPLPTGSGRTIRRDC